MEEIQHVVFTSWKGEIVHASSHFFLYININGTGGKTVFGYICFPGNFAVMVEIIQLDIARGYC